MNTIVFSKFAKQILKSVLCFYILGFGEVTFLYAQHPKVNVTPNLSEKIYLQLDSKVYTTDKTIWFKAIVTNTATHIPTVLSNVLYVEMIDPNERILQKKILKLKDGIGDGYFDLNQAMPDGYYQIRAYTNWNRNFGDDFYFKEYVEVFAPIKQGSAEAVNKFTLIEEADKTHWLSADLHPSVAADSKTAKLNVFLTMGDKKDSLVVKKSAKDLFHFNYKVPDKCKVVTLQVKDIHGITYSKQIALNKNDIDVQFFPESGEMVHGLRSKVGFKAVDVNGKGKPVTGDIFDIKGNKVAQFKSNTLGMGYFILDKPDSAAHYYASIHSDSLENTANKYVLPPVLTYGNTLTFLKKDDFLEVKVVSNYPANDSVHIRISCRGIGFGKISGWLKDTLDCNIPISKLPEGVISFTLTDKLWRPLAERVYFNLKPESRLGITLATDKPDYTQRDSTILQIETTDSNGRPAKSNLSVLVINKEQMGPMQNLRQNILSYFLLSSDLKGDIENPGYYFTHNDTSLQSDLDALMLTQGWRKYKYKLALDSIRYLPESHLSLSGSVSGLLFLNKKKDGVNMTLLAIGKNLMSEKKMTDSQGRFKFILEDEYDKPVNYTLQSVNKRGKQENYTIALDQPAPPAVTYNHNLEISEVDSVAQAFVSKNIERKKVDDAFPISPGSILLKEVKVEAYKMTPQRKMAAEEYGKPDLVIEGKDIQAKVKNWHYGLFSVLDSDFPEKLKCDIGSYGNISVNVRGAEETLFLVDGKFERLDYSDLSVIPPSEVTSVEIIRNPKKWRELYIFQYGTAPKVSDVAIIVVYTRSGKGINYAFKPAGIYRGSCPSFSLSKEFYQPKYRNLTANDWVKPDLRALVHWQPILVTDATGKASSTWFNADNTGNVEVVVEAISDKGEIGYRELTYGVAARKR